MNIFLKANSLPSHVKIVVSRTNVFEDSFQQVSFFLQKFEKELRCN